MARKAWTAHAAALSIMLVLGASLVTLVPAVLAGSAAVIVVAVLLSALSR
jgi:hypothetical protein